jgi:hypothetical protein
MGDLIQAAPAAAAAAAAVLAVAGACAVERGAKRGMVLPRRGGGRESKLRPKSRKPRAVYLVQQKQARPDRPLVLLQQRSWYPLLL